MHKSAAYMIAIVIILAGCMQNKDNLNENLKIEQSNKGGFTMKITSTAFNDNESIPKKFTCQGDKINPGLEISDVPNGTKSLALIMDDPDAPFGTYIHWLVKDISPQTKTIGENSIPGTEFINSGGSPSYVPPCPPSGIHRYFFKIYALDVSTFEAKNKADFYRQVQNHKIAESQIIGKYQKS